MERIVLPVLGKMNCRTITAPLVLREILRPIEDRGENDVAHAISQLISMILRFAVASSYADSDVIPNCWSRAKIANSGRVKIAKISRLKTANPQQYHRNLS